MEMNRGRPASGERGDLPIPASNLRRRRRSAWNPATWTPVTTSFSPNRTYRAPGTPGGRRFAPTEHLAAEAVAAFADGELGMTAHMRAAQHLALCTECMAAVDAQVAARSRLRSAGDVSLPAGLLGQLSQIPTREIDMTGSQGGSSPLSPEAPLAPGFPVTEAGRDRAGDEIADHHSTRGRMSRWRGR
ncbi:hypothetical protein [Gordonia sp. CPCC 205515]|uniref:hypothetical protein n=1 Tax=Gordonia sp. CPCC 205515 TaxID=3140791 RepID=UPI003AF36DED